MKNFNQYRQQFSTFYEGVKVIHLTSSRPHRGHGLDHDVTVAQLAAQFAPNQRTAAKAWCGAMLHSIDRIVEKDEVEEITRLLASHLSSAFAAEEVEEIVQAALRHMEKNQDDQSLTQQCLMDGDRIANMMPTVIIRAAQCQPHLPPFEFEYLAGSPNPASSYFNILSVLDDLRIIISEYLPQFRLPKAKKLSQKYATQLRRYIAEVEKGNRDLGLAGITL